MATCKTTGRLAALLVVALLALTSLASAVQVNNNAALQSQAQTSALEMSKTNADPVCKCYCCSGNGCEEEYVGDADVDNCDNCSDSCKNTYSVCDAAPGTRLALCTSDASRLQSGALLAAAIAMVVLAITWAF